MSDFETMGKMRLAGSTLENARAELREMYEAGDEMLTPAKADELVKIVREMKVAIADMEPIIEEFHALGERRKAQRVL